MSRSEAGEYESPVRIILTCSKAWVPESSVTIDDIHEDIFGRDVVRFRCPTCGEWHESLRLG